MVSLNMVLRSGEKDMQHTILIVDDEAWHRRGMTNLLKSLYPEVELLEAKNGSTALELCKNREIDIVITDINMPNMDGLEFMRRLHDLKPDIKIIVLTAYNKFEYAKAAIKYGVIDFILKPVKVSELQDVLQKTFSILSREFVERKKHHQFESYMLQADQLRQNHLVNQWLLNETKDSNLIDQISQFLDIYSMPGNVILFNLASPIHKENREELVIYLKENITDSLFYLESNPNILMAICIKEPLSDSILKKAIRWCQDKLGQNMKVVVGRHVTDLASEAYISYQNAYSVLPLHFYEKSNPLFGEAINLTFYPANNKHYYHYEKELIQMFQEGKLSQALQTFHNLVYNFFEPGNLPPYSARQIATCILYNLLNHFDYAMPHQRQLQLFGEIDLILVESNTISQLSTLATNIIEQIYLEVSLQKEVTNNRMNQILEYIDEHYMENITLSEVADRFSFHPSYFSTLFKSISGKSFTDYISEKRMNKAKELLKNPSNKIRDISENLGFSSPGYFAKTFKRFFGVTPEDFRKSNGTYKENE